MFNRLLSSQTCRPLFSNTSLASVLAKSLSRGHTSNPPLLSESLLCILLLSISLLVGFAAVDWHRDQGFKVEIMLYTASSV